VHIKKLIELCRQENIDLWFEDECHFQQHGSSYSMWIPPEIKDPILLHAPTRKKQGVFGAVQVSEGRLVTHLEQTFNALTFQSFLAYVLRYRTPDKLMVLVLDNARWHHAKLIQPWLMEHRHMIQLDFLPPYSPELNPIERVWKLTRRLCTHNRYFPQLDDLTQTVSQQFMAWMNPNNTLRKLCAVT
jgi:transposase